MYPNDFARMTLDVTCDDGAVGMDFLTLANDAVPPPLATLCREIGNIELGIEELQTFVEVAFAPLLAERSPNC